MSHQSARPFLLGLRKKFIRVPSERSFISTSTPVQKTVHWRHSRCRWDPTCLQVLKLFLCLLPGRCMSSNVLFLGGLMSGPNPVDRFRSQKSMTRLLAPRTPAFSPQVYAKRRQEESSLSDHMACTRLSTSSSEYMSFTPLCGSVPALASTECACAFTLCSSIHARIAGLY